MNSNITIGSPAGMANAESLLPRIPEVLFSIENVGNLRMPLDLFDEKTPPVSDAYRDALVPIIIMKSEIPGEFVIIDGCKRVRGFLEIGQERCSCGIVKNPINFIHAGLLRILLNNKRDLHIRERVCFWKWLRKCFSEEDMNRIAPLLGFPLSERQELMGLASEGEEVLDAVAQGMLSPRAVADLGLLKQDDQRAFLNAFSFLRLSQQAQREFLQWLPEIAFAKTTSISDLLGSKEIENIRNSELMNGPQKIEAIRNLLFAWNFPQFSEASKNWKKLAASIAASMVKNQSENRLEFIPSQAFEKNKLEIHISVSQAQGAREIFKLLAEVSTQTWSQLIYPISH